jgi:hypothetical protein
MTKVLVSVDCDYVQGYLRHGHFELVLDKETMKTMTKEEIVELVNEDGRFVLDDYSNEDIGRGDDYEVSEISEEKMVTIPESKYQNLLYVEASYDALEAAGVDNWEGFEHVEWPQEDKFFKN